MNERALAQPAEGVDPRTDHLINAYYPPLMIHEGADQPGISIEIVREAARRLGRQTSAEFLPFRRALKTLRNSDDAIQPALYRLPSREANFRWIVLTHYVDDVFLTIGEPINSIEEARALPSIGVEAEASMDSYLTALGFTNLERVDRPDANAEKLRAGRISAWALTRPLAQWTWRQMGFKETLVAGAVLRSAPVYVVASHGFPDDLAADYRRVIEAMKQDGTVARILSAY